MFLIKKILAAICVAFLALTLSACGGGEDEVVLAAPAPAPMVLAPVVTAPAPVEADVTFRQINTRLDVLPGESIRATVAAITCKGMNKDGVCPSFVPVGDIGIVDETGAEYELLNIGLYYLGQKLDGWIINEGAGKYRFRSTGGLFIYQAGSLEIRATVSPWATSGVVHTLMLKTVDYDKVLSVVQAKAELVVRADPTYQPMNIGTNSNGYINPNQDGRPVTVQFTAQCGAPVGNCHASLDFGWVRGLVAGSPVLVCRTESNGTKECYDFGAADQFGEFYLNLGLNPESGGGSTTYQVTFTPAQPTYLVAQRLESWINGVQIAPRVTGPEGKASDCSALANRNCKG